MDSIDDRLMAAEERMRRLTRDRARFWIVSALSDAMVRGSGGRRCMDIVMFNPDGLATDDDRTTWAEVFAAADLKDWENKAGAAADASEAMHKEER